MSTFKTTTQLMKMTLVAIAVISCNQKAIDPAATLDEVFIPEGFIQSDELSLDMETRLEEMRLSNSEDYYYYLKIKDGPVGTEKEVSFPQNELKIEVIDHDMNTEGKSQYHGVIVKKIKGDWTDELFQYFDKKAEPKGGMEAFKTLVSEKLKYPEAALENKVEGRVFVQFIVKKDGTLSQVQAVKGLGYGCDEEAVRFIHGESEWIPAQIMEKNVNSRVIIPVMFKLE